MGLEKDDGKRRHGHQSKRCHGLRRKPAAEPACRDHALTLTPFRNDRQPLDLQPLPALTVTWV
jgi:hypothetical protein